MEFGQQHLVLDALVANGALLLLDRLSDQNWNVYIIIHTLYIHILYLSPTYISYKYTHTHTHTHTICKVVLTYSNSSQ